MSPPDASPPDATAQQQSQSDPGCRDYPQSSADYAPHRQNWRTWLAPPALQGLLALTVYAAVWLSTVARPLVVHPGRAQLLTGSPDPNFYVWSLRWWPYAFAHGLNPMYTNLVAAPAGHSLAWVTTVPPLALLAAPLTLTAGPVVAFNLLTALALPVSAWAAFLACRRLTGRFWPALVGGAVYGFSAYELNHIGAGQLNMGFALLPPLLVCLILSWRDGTSGRATFVILTSLVLALQFYLFLETFADVTAVFIVALALGLALAGRDGRHRLRQLAGLLGLSYLVALALAAPYLADALSSAPPAVPAYRSMDLTSLVLPRPGHSLGLVWLARAEAGIRPASAGCSVGIPLLAVMVVLAATRWHSRLVRLLTVMFVVITVGALGPVVYVGGHREVRLPWRGLFSLPFVRNAYPSRLILFAFLILALATALLLAGDTGDRQSGRWAQLSLAGRWCLGVLVIAFGVLNAAGPRHLAAHTTVPAFVSSGEYRRQLTAGEIVMVVSRVGNAGMLWQAESGDYWRLAGGFINDGFEHRTDLPGPAQRLDRPTPARIHQVENLIRAGHIGAILVDARHAPSWAGVFRTFGLIGHRVGGVIVYRTDGCRTCRGVTRAEINAATFPS